jgi:hypothetical protein
MIIILSSNRFEVEMFLTLRLAKSIPGSREVDSRNDPGCRDAKQRNVSEYSKRSPNANFCGLCSKQVLRVGQLSININ